MSKTPTREQQLAIDTIDKNVVVSASAGSGKTSTMVERIISILKSNSATLNELLALTFTKAAAEEITTRLSLELNKYTNMPSICKQLVDLPTADISNIHSFCGQLIKKYFYIVNIDPNFGIVDDVEAKFLKNRAIDFTIQTLNKQNDQGFLQLTRAMRAVKDTTFLKTTLFEVHDFIENLKDKDGFLQNIALHSYETALDANECFSYLLNQMQEGARYHFSVLDTILKECTKNEYVFISDKIQSTVDFLKVLSSKDFSDVSFFKVVPVFENFLNTKMARELELQNDAKVARLNAQKFIEDYREIFAFGKKDAIVSSLQSAKVYAQEILKVYELFNNQYVKLKKTGNCLDFNDLETYALKILENKQANDAIAKKYKFVFVDEFQDTSEKQDAILGKINAFANVFVVGDPKQSIYAFRNARPDLMLKKIDNFEKTEDGININFNANFRSSKAVLDFVNMVFDKVMTKKAVDIDYKAKARFDTSKLKTDTQTSQPKVFIGVLADVPQKEKKESKKTDGAQEVYSVLKAQNLNAHEEESLSEEDLIVQYVSNLFKSGTQIFDKSLNCERALKYSDICILSARRKNFENIYKKLDEHGYSVVANYNLNLLDCGAVQTLHNTLKILNNYKDDIALGALLVSPIGGFSNQELVEIRSKNMDSKYFYIAVDEYRKNMGDEIAKKLNTFFKKIERYRFRLNFVSIFDIAYEILQEHDLMLYWLSFPNGKDTVKKVELFLNTINAKSFNSSVVDYISFVENFKSAFEIKFSSVSDDDSIKIMTIHNSKGLEFPVVIVAGAGDRFELSDKGALMLDSEFGLGFSSYDLEDMVKASSLVNFAIKNKKKINEIKEAMRVLYVACTRAKNYLAIIGKAKQIKQSIATDYSILQARSFFDWIFMGIDKNLDCEKEHVVQIGKDMELQVFLANQKGAEKITTDMPKISVAEDNSLATEISKSLKFCYPNISATNTNQKSSVSKLLTQGQSEDDIKSIEYEFLTDTTFRNTLEEASRVGIAYHKAFECVDFGSTDKDIIGKTVKENLSEEELILINPDKICKAVEVISGLIESGDRVYKEKKFMLYVPYNQAISGSLVADRVLVQGVVDLIIISKSRAIIVDYKTNKFKDDSTFLSKYNLQLKLYGMAVQKHFNVPKICTYIYSIEKGKLIEL